MYGIEAVDLDSYEFLHLKYCYDRSFMKIFGSFDKNVIRQCQMYSNCLDFSHLVDKYRLNFLSNIAADIFLPYCDPSTELLELCNKYNINTKVTSAGHTDKIIFQHFANYILSN